MPKKRTKQERFEERERRIRQFKSPVPPPTNLVEYMHERVLEENPELGDALNFLSSGMWDLGIIEDPVSAREHRMCVKAGVAAGYSKEDAEKGCKIK